MKMSEKEILKELNKLTGGDDRGNCYQYLKDDVENLISLGLIFVNVEPRFDTLLVWFDDRERTDKELVELGMKVCDYGADEIEFEETFDPAEGKSYMKFSLWWD